MPTLQDGRISARRNPHFKRFLAVLARKDRASLLVEGPKMLEEVRKAGLAVEIIAVDESKLSRADLGIVRGQAAAVLSVTPALMREISDVETSQGIVALVQRPVPNRTWIKGPRAFILILDRIQDPGNVGTLFRSAEALGVTGVLMTQGCADPFSSKALRASAGSALRLPHVAGLSPGDIFDLLPGTAAILAAVAAKDATSIFEANLKKTPLAIALGSEGSGLDPAFRGERCLEVRIPQAREVESLNVAVAGSILMFEAARRLELFKKV